MTILIDNGHGKNTPGKRSPYSTCGIMPAYDFFEWEFNRSIARALLLKLRSVGYDARQIVTEEIDISLAQRCARVNEICKERGSRNTLLVSIHADAFGDGSSWSDAHGWSAYTTKGETRSDALAECLYRAAELKFHGRKIRKDTSDGDSDKEENFYILKHTECPAVLTENFFYTNVDDIRFMRSREGQAAIVAAHLDGITEFIKSI